MADIVLPYPHPCLNPNSTAHWTKKSPLKKQMRTLACALTKEAKFSSNHLCITFHPPDRRKRDLDNMLASIKSMLDGVADAMSIDDSNFKLTIQKSNPVKNGQVIITESLI
jgi:crossover junction endodeoxyribonuclease RusA